MNKYRMLWLGVAVLTIALAAQATMYATAKPDGTAHAVWAFQAKSFSDVVNKATVVVEVQVVSVAKGPDITIPLSQEPEGEDVVPTQHITVQVLKSDKGSMAPGQQLTVFRTGGETNIPAGPPAGTTKGDPNSAPPPTNVKVKVLLLDDDPAYSVGERYFLLMVPGPNGTLRPVSPDGRYHITASGTLTPVSGSDVAKSVSGRTVQDALAAAKGGSN